MTEQVVSGLSGRGGAPGPLLDCLHFWGSGGVSDRAQDAHLKGGGPGASLGSRRPTASGPAFLI